MDTIIGNCDTTLFLGGKEKTTLKEISDILGKETIDTFNTGESRGQSASYSMNYQKLGKALMSEDEIAVMDGSKCLLQVRGVRPFLSTKYDIEKHHNYRFLADADPSKNFDIAEFVKAFKDSKAKLLEGLSRKNTKHVIIEINDDEPVEAAVKPSSTPAAASSATSTEPATIPTDITKAPMQTEEAPIEPAIVQNEQSESQAEITNTQGEPAVTTETMKETETSTNQNDINIDNYEDDEDDSDDFDPDDTELV